MFTAALEHTFLINGSLQAEWAILTSNPEKISS